MGAIKHILVPTDFSEYSANALKHALVLAEQQGATVTALHVVTLFNVGSYSKRPHTSPTLKFLYYRLKRQAKRLLKDFIEKNRINQITINLAVESGFSVGEEILSYISTNRVDFVVAGTQGKGALKKIFLGSVAEKLMEEAPCPVMVVKIGSFMPTIIDYQQILVGVDFSKTSERALQKAIDLVKNDATIHVMHVIEDNFLANYGIAMEPTFSKFIPHLQSMAADKLDQLIKRAAQKRKVVPVLEVGPLVETLVNYAEKNRIDLIFLGATGEMSAEQSILGRIPERVIRKAKCPVIVVK